MGSGSYEDQAVAFLAPDQKPVRPDVAFPAIGPVAGQPVRPEAWVERLLRGKAFNDGPEFIQVPPPSPGPSEVPLELCGCEQAHSSAEFGPEGLQVVILGEALAVAGAS